MNFKNYSTPIITDENYSNILAEYDYMDKRCIKLIIIFSNRVNNEEIDFCVKQWSKTSVKKIRISCLCGEKKMCYKYINSINNNIIYICDNCCKLFVNYTTTITSICELCKKITNNFEIVCETCIKKHEQLKTCILKEYDEIAKEKKKLESREKNYITTYNEILKQDEIIEKNNNIIRDNILLKKNDELIKKIQKKIFDTFICKNIDQSDNYKFFLKNNVYFDSDFIEQMGNKFLAIGFPQKYTGYKYCNSCFDFKIPKQLNIITCNECLENIIDI